MTEENSRLAGLLTIIIVTHRNLDDDNVISCYLLIKGLGLEINDPRIEFIFVPKGDAYNVDSDSCAERQERIRRGLVDGTLKIFHVDTGGQTDPLNGHFDHHRDLTYSCAAEVVVKHFWGGERFIPPDRQIYRRLLRLAIFRDSASAIGAEDESTAKLRRGNAEVLRKAFRDGTINVPLTVIIDRGGLDLLSKVIHNLPGDDEAVMRHNLLNIESLLRDEIKANEFAQYFREQKSARFQTTLHGVRMIIIPNCPYNHDETRHHVKRNFYEDDADQPAVHLIVISYKNHDNPYETDIAINLVHNDSRVGGLDSLFQKLSEKIRNAERPPFRHPSGAIIHFYNPPFSIEDVSAMAEDCVFLTT
ncbi:MAG: hypothetical protein ACOZBH_02335 [Patescibacteria group bacterium]